MQIFYSYSVRRPQRVSLLLRSAAALCLLLGICQGSRAQDQTTLVRNAFTSYQEKFIREEIYARTDRDVYLPGDICWFRLYIVDAVWHHPLDISKIAYVDLIDANGKSWVQEKVSLKPGEQGNSFVMPVGLPSGNYTLRAYTRWMRNGSPDWFFHKNLTVISPNNTDSLADANPDNRPPDIQFFPEGGNLVRGLNSRIGFRVTDAFGRGQRFEGVVLGNAGDTLIRFSPDRLGMGQFDFTPADTTPSKILLRMENGKLLESKLPAAFPQGYVMRVDTSADVKRLEVTVNTSGISDPNIFLSVQTRGSFRWGKALRLQSGKAVFSVDRDSLNPGISVLTLLGDRGQPICERLFFSYPRIVPGIEAHTQQEYTTRKQVDLDISLDEAARSFSPGDLSVAVYRPDLPGEASGMASDIRSYFWLESDLGHAVESAGLYFSDTVALRTRMMENLMLTQGWRRFSWKDLFAPREKNPEYGPEFNGHVIEAKMLDAAGRPRIDQTSYLSVPGSYTRFRVTQTDSSGLAVYEMPWFYNSDEIVLQTDVPNSHVHFDVVSPFAPASASGSAYHPLTLNDAVSGNLLDEHVRNQVQRIYIGPKMRRFDAPLVDTGFFYGSPDEKYNLDDFVRFTTMEEVLREYVVSINVYRKRGNLQVQVFDTENKKFFDAAPLLLIDGIPVFDQGKLFRYDPLKIRRLDLMTRPYFMGYQRFEGVMNLVTYRGNLDGFEMDSAANVLEYPGINAQREFYSPKYETEQAVASRLPDFRSLLFWSPQVLTGADGKAHLSFYTSDLPGDYNVVIQGMTSDGRPAARTVSFTVKK